MQSARLASAILILISTLAPVATPSESGPRHKAVITCFNGKIDSGSRCSASCFQPDGTLFKTGTMTCGWPGKVSEIKWTFIGRRGDKDAYRISRRFPVDAPATTTTQKEVEFAGDRVKVFEDESQCIIMDKPRQ
jgi:hypothetical protein